MLTNAIPITDPPSFQKLGKTVGPKEDPTRTRTLRARWVRQMRKRWNLVAASVPALLAEIQDLPPTRQVEQFIANLQLVESQTILERNPREWIYPFVSAAFARGVIRGNRELRQIARQPKRKGSAVNAVKRALRLVTNQQFEIPTIAADNVEANMIAGQRAEVFEMEVQSTWQGITGVTEQVNAQVAQVLSQSIQARSTLQQTAAAIADRIDKVGKTRSEMIARTETVAANNRGAVAEYSIAEGIIGEPVLVQWIATLDNRVRPAHLARHGKVFTRDEYLSLINEPNCRCSGAGYVESIEGTVEKSEAKQFKDMTTGKPKG